MHRTGDRQAIGPVFCKFPENGSPGRHFDPQVLAVETMGLEPTTPGLQSRCSPN